MASDTPTPMINIRKEDGGWVVIDERERHGPYRSYTEAVKQAHTLAPEWVFAEAEAQLAALNADQMVVINVTDAETGRSRTFGARGGFAVSTIRDGLGLRKFILVQLDTHRRNGPRGDCDTLDEDQIARVEIEEY
jgi:hypothetical protein